MLEGLLTKLPEYGLAGILIAIGTVVVLKPMIRAWTKSIEGAHALLEKQGAEHSEEIEAQRQERMAACERHMKHDDESLRVMEGLRSSVDALVRRANGGG